MEGRGQRGCGTRDEAEGDYGCPINASAFTIRTIASCYRLIDPFRVSCPWNALTLYRVALFFWCFFLTFLWRER